jgi:hypothetical protein
VVLCDSTEELLDEGWTCPFGAMCQVVHQIGRELQTPGVERDQLPSQPFVRERELNRVIDAARAIGESCSKVSGRFVVRMKKTSARSRRPSSSFSLLAEAVRHSAQEFTGANPHAPLAW